MLLQFAERSFRPWTFTLVMSGSPFLCWGGVVLRLLASSNFFFWPALAGWVLLALRQLIWRPGVREEVSLGLTAPATRCWWCINFIRDVTDDLPLRIQGFEGHGFDSLEAA